MHLIPRSYIALPGHERIIGVDVHEYVGISVVDGREGLVCNEDCLSLWFEVYLICRYVYEVL